MKTIILLQYTALILSIVVLLYFIIKDIIKNRKERRDWARYLGGITCTILLFLSIHNASELTIEDKQSINLSRNKIEKLNNADIISKPKIKLNDSTLYEYMLKLNMEHPKIVLAQAKIESSNYSSNVYNNSCNLFGMGLANSRATLAIGSYKGYSVFETWEMCVIDYALYQAKHFSGLSDEEYLNKLQQIYATNPNYKTIITKKIKELKVKTKL